MFRFTKSKLQRATLCDIFLEHLKCTDHVSDILLWSSCLGKSSFCDLTKIKSYFSYICDFGRMFIVEAPLPFKGEPGLQEVASFSIRFPYFDIAPFEILHTPSKLGRFWPSFAFISYKNVLYFAALAYGWSNQSICYLQWVLTFYAKNVTVYLMLSSFNVK